MAVNENVKKGAYYRHCSGFSPEGDPIYTRISFWTDSSDVKFEDGSDLKTILEPLVFTPLTGTLPAGEVELVINNSLIIEADNVKYRIYTTQYGFSPNTVELQPGSLKMTFPDHEDAVGVKIEIYKMV